MEGQLPAGRFSYTALMLFVVLVCLCLVLHGHSSQIRFHNIHSERAIWYFEENSMPRRASLTATEKLSPSPSTGSTPGDRSCCDKLIDSIIDMAIERAKSGVLDNDYGYIEKMNLYHPAEDAVLPDYGFDLFYRKTATGETTHTCTLLVSLILKSGTGCMLPSIYLFPDNPAGSINGTETKHLLDHNLSAAVLDRVNIANESTDCTHRAKDLFASSPLLSRVWCHLKRQRRPRFTFLSATCLHNAQVSLTKLFCSARNSIAKFAARILVSFVIYEQCVFFVDPLIVFLPRNRWYCADRYIMQRHVSSITRIFLDFVRQIRDQPNPGASLAVKKLPSASFLALHLLNRPFNTQKQGLAWFVCPPRASTAAGEWPASIGGDWSAGVGGEWSAGMGGRMALE